MIYAYVRLLKRCPSNIAPIRNCSFGIIEKTRAKKKITKNANVLYRDLVTIFKYDLPL